MTNKVSISIPHRDLETRSVQRKWALDIGYLSDPGRQRDLNEDSFLVLAPPAIVPEIDAFMAVADGMGGHQAGEVASEMVMASAAQWFTSDEYRQYVTYGSQHDDYFVVVLKELLEHLNSRVYDMAARQSQLSGMGTTATVALIQGEHLFLGHVGDSRAYLLRQEQLHRLSQDHTWVMEQIQNGLMSLEEAAQHPKRHVLTQALGYGPVVRPERQQHRLQAGDILLLCSDGLSSVVSDETLRQMLLAADAQTVCSQLVSLANQGGGPDNITVIVAHLLRRVREDSHPDQSSGMPPGFVKGLAGGQILGPLDRYRSAESQVSDTLPLPSKSSNFAAKALHAIKRGVLPVLGILLAFGAGWALHLPTIKDSMPTEWTAAALTTLSFLAGLIVGRGLRSR